MVNFIISFNSLRTALQPRRLPSKSYQFAPKFLHRAQNEKVAEVDRKQRSLNKLRIFIDCRPAPDSSLTFHIRKDEQEKLLFDQILKSILVTVPRAIHLYISHAWRHTSHKITHTLTFLE